ncbi:FecR family protein [Longitalea arenae]|uniref:FecR family protein n=1 Tax=Longitalea arenae TaxID=2812558 RepID=UPI001967B529|nr:FecR domain-containing protein [Longitalea arenae]
MENINKDLLRRWIDGKCSPEEAEYVQRYLQQIKPDLFSRQLDDDWKNASVVMSTTDTAYLWQLVRSQIKPKARTVLLTGQWKKIAVAASVLTFLLTASWFGISQRQHKTTAAKVWKTVYNNKAGKISLQLPDRSTVWLSKGAVLKYAADIAKGTRQLQLMGEAFFDVSKDSLHPFTVQAGKVKITVLGTRFNVEAYEKEQITRISLIEGSVSTNYADARHKSITTLLTPGNMLCYNGVQGEANVQAVNITDANAFISDNIVLQDISLNDALNRIGAHYGKTIHLQNNHDDQQQLSAVVPGNNLEAALSNLAFIYRLQYRIGQDTIQVVKQ